MVWRAKCNAIGNAKFYSRLHDAVIRVYDEAGNVIETHEHAGDFKRVIAGKMFATTGQSANLNIVLGEQPPLIPARVWGAVIFWVALPISESVPSLQRKAKGADGR